MLIMISEMALYWNDFARDKLFHKISDIAKESQVENSSIPQWFFEDVKLPLNQEGDRVKIQGKFNPHFGGLNLDNVLIHTRQKYVNKVINLMHEIDSAFHT